ncbi:hypothetical protein ACP4OV_014603 [Aristida adscensionis]
MAHRGKKARTRDDGPPASMLPSPSLISEDAAAVVTAAQMPPSLSLLSEGAATAAARNQSGSIGSPTAPNPSQVANSM